MADNYTHRYNANNAIEIAGYTPRHKNCLIMGANGPDPLFFYQMYNSLRRYNLYELGSIMHIKNTGLFLRNLFTMAKTDAQKDYCLGFLCHYSLDSTIHPYVKYVTESYGSVFNISSGHGYFESALDSKLSLQSDGVPYANVDKYCPELSEMELKQISHLFRQAVMATYPEYNIPQHEYIQAFKDFRLLKKFFYSPSKIKFPIATIIEKLLGFKEGYIKSHMQPNNMEIPDYPFWKNIDIDLYSAESLDSLLLRADYLSAESIRHGLKFFDGTYTIEDMMQAVGDNKSYETGLVVE